MPWSDAHRVGFLATPGRPAPKKAGPAEGAGSVNYIRRFDRSSFFRLGLLAAVAAGCAGTPDDAHFATPDLRPAAGKVDTKPFECIATSDPGGFTFDHIAVWRDDAKAAYTMIHDDMCGRDLRGIDRLAVPALA